MITEILSEADRKHMEETAEKLNAKFKETAVRSKNKLPYSAREGVHDDNTENPQRWTNGFFGGLMWLLYSFYGKEEYKAAARTSERLLDAAFSKIEKMNHDTGFMWHLTAGADYALTGDGNAKNRNLLAAMVLASRYNPDGGFIRAWPEKGCEGWTIIDCMMNLPQLYWASEVTGDDRFKRIALRQADLTMKDHVRADGSVNHIVSHSLNKPEVLETLGGQGYGVGSCWSRGQAWAVYGFAASYFHTREEKYLETARRAARYFIGEAAKENFLPLADFKAPKEPVLYDSTAGAICASGLIDVAKYVKSDEAPFYLGAAVNILKALEKWCDFSPATDGLLANGRAAYHGAKPENIIYGDFYFTEAVLKLCGNSFGVW